MLWKPGWNTNSQEIRMYFTCYCQHHSTTPSVLHIYYDTLGRCQNLCPRIEYERECGQQSNTSFKTLLKAGREMQNWVKTATQSLSLWVSPSQHVENSAATLLKTWIKRLEVKHQFNYFTCSLIRILGFSLWSCGSSLSILEINLL